MITAKEAREISKLNGELKELRDLIALACERGATDIESRVLSDKAVVFLKALGYTIVKFDEWNVYKIMW